MRLHRTPGRVRRRAVAAAAALLAAAGPAHAQELRTVEFARQQRDSLALDVRVEHAAGKVTVHGADQPLLYQAQLAYDPRRTEALHAFDAEARQLQVGARRHGRDGAAGDAAELRLDVTRSVPVSLTLRMGTSEADLDLGGMRLRRLAVESGASDAVLHFDAPNLVAMERLELDVGAASLRARGLANARARDIRVNVGVGAAELDFGGDWTGDIVLDLDLTLGSATIRVPEEVGVRVATTRVIASFERQGFTRRDGAYYSANWDSAPRKLEVRGRVILGKLTLARGAS
jgi:hypothetical protein